MRIQTYPNVSKIMFDVGGPRTHDYRTLRPERGPAPGNKNLPAHSHTNPNPSAPPPPFPKTTPLYQEPPQIRRPFQEYNAVEPYGIGVLFRAAPSAASLLDCFILWLAPWLSKP